MSPLETIQTSTHPFIIGSDEVGWGSLAGPLMVGVTAVPRDWTWPGLRDSKELKKVPGRLEHLAEALTGKVFFHHEVVLAREMERLGAGAALEHAHRKAIQRALVSFPDALVVVDGSHVIPGVPHVLLPKADTLVPAVMAAAVQVKVIRDRYMRGLHYAFPQYNFWENAGYGAPAHMSMIKQIGGSVAHRRNYNPWKTMLEKKLP